MGWLRMQLDKVLLSDHAWKEKYCPTLFGILAGEIDIMKIHTKERAQKFFEEGCRQGVCGVIHIERGDDHLKRLGQTIESATESERSA